MFAKFRLACCQPTVTVAVLPVRFVGLEIVLGPRRRIIVSRGSSRVKHLPESGCVVPVFLEVLRQSCEVPTGVTPVLGQVVNSGRVGSTAGQQGRPAWRADGLL